MRKCNEADVRVLLEIALSIVMPAHSRPKDGVLSHAYVAGIHVLRRENSKAWMASEVGLARLPH